MPTLRVVEGITKGMRWGRFRCYFGCGGRFNYPQAIEHLMVFHSKEIAMDWRESWYLRMANDVNRRLDAANGQSVRCSVIESMACDHFVAKLDTRTI